MPHRSSINFSPALKQLYALRDLAREAHHDALEQGLLDLQGVLLGLQVQSLEQQVEGRLVHNEAIRLRNCLSMAKKLKRVDDAYYVTHHDGDTRGPYCVTCWERRDILQGLIEGEDETGYCPNCKDKVQTGRPDAWRGAKAG
ncbi:MAG: hypothetical protein ACO1Q7_20080 [Gemmatimonas sp.]